MDLEKISSIVTKIDRHGAYPPGIRGMRVKLVNGWEASIITGSPLHGGREDLFEVAPITPQGEIDDFNVQGYLNTEEVIEMVRDIATREHAIGRNESQNSIDN